MFKLFDLRNTGKIDQNDLTTMIYNLPHAGKLIQEMEDSQSTSSMFDLKPDQSGKHTVYHIEKSPSRFRQEGIVSSQSDMGSESQLSMLPAKIAEIVHDILDSITDKHEFDYPDFVKWLDQNPMVVQLIEQAFRPELWAKEIIPAMFSTISSKASSMRSHSSTMTYNDTISSNMKLHYAIRTQKSFEEIDEDRKSIMEGYLWKIGKKSKILIKRYYVLKHNALYIYDNKSDKEPSSIIFLRGVYVETQFHKDKKGIFLFHDLSSFKQKLLFTKNDKDFETWFAQIKNEAGYKDVYDHYNKSKHIGTGKFSKVYLATNKQTQEQVAIKEIIKADLNAKEKILLREEILIIQLVNHPQVVDYREVYETKNFVYIVMELVQGGELYHYVRENPIKPKTMAEITIQLLTSVKYLHLCGVIHRDLKLENVLVLLDEETNQVKSIKISDFGLSKLTGPTEQLSHACGTLAYVGPEVLLKQGYSKEVDAWSIGVMCYTMVSRHLPFWDIDQSNLIKMIKTQEPDYDNKGWITQSPTVVDFIRRLLVKDPKSRMSIDEAINHPMFTELGVGVESKGNVGIIANRMMKATPMKVGK